MSTSVPYRANHQSEATKLMESVSLQNKAQNGDEDVWNVSASVQCSTNE